METNMATKAEMEQEAALRLEMLTKMGLHENVVREFKENGHDGENGLYYSDSQIMRITFPGGREISKKVGVLYWLDNDGEAEELKAIVEKVEKKTDVLAYMAIHGHYVYGGYDHFEMLDVLVVTPYKEDWEKERKDLANLAPFCWVENMTAPDLSEFDWVPVELCGGGLARRC